MSNVNVSEKPGTDQLSDKAAEAAGSVKEQAESTAENLKDQAGQVASTAQEEIGHLAGEAKGHAVDLLDETMKQVQDQSRVQRDRLVGTLQTFSDDLEQMASSSQGGLAADLGRQLATRSRNFSQRLDGREPAELLGEVKSFAQRRPGTFLLGALAAGVVAGRLVRGAKDAPPKDATTANTQVADTQVADTQATNVQAATPLAPQQPSPDLSQTRVVSPEGAL